MTSSGSVPLSLSPNMVRNMVKLIGPGASAIIPSRYSSEGFLPEDKTQTGFKATANMCAQTVNKQKHSESLIPAKKKTPKHLHII